MPSSTSSSDHLHVPARPIPGGRWGLPWLVTLVVVIASLVGLERFVRSRGYVPSMKDDVYLWAWERARVDQPRTLVVLGTSRMQLAWSPAAAHAKLPDWNLVNLAIDGAPAIGSLADLARDPDFRGVVIVDVYEPQMSMRYRDADDAWVRAYHDRWSAPGAMIERWLATQVQTRIALDAAAGRRALGALLATGDWPPPPYVTTYADRSRYADFSRANVDELRAERVAKLPDARARDADAWLAEVRPLDELVDAIRRRGGRVVFVRMPTCDERWASDEARYPKASFWDRFAAITHATAVHFTELPDQFACPDTSHIDSKDGPRFTADLLDLLAARGVI